MKREKRLGREIALALILAGAPSSAQEGGRSIRPERPLFQDFSGDPTKPNPYDETWPLEARARAYLDDNCAHCHQPGGAGKGGMDLRFHVPLERTALFAPGGRPGTDGMALLHIRPGHPLVSEVYLRMSSLGIDAMPPMGQANVDKQGLALIREWIESLAADSPSSMRPAWEKIPRVHYFRQPKLQISPLGPRPEELPQVRIFDAAGENVADISISTGDNPAKQGWALRFPRPLPRGRYWMEIVWGGEKHTRYLLVL